MKNSICKICPNHCNLEIIQGTDGIQVSGNHCPRGIKFAADEINGNSKIFHGHIPSNLSDISSINVRTNEAIAPELIFKLIRYIKKCTITQPIPNGCVVEKNVMGLGVDLIVDDERF